MTKEECLAMGGHCWVNDGIVLASNPPQYPEHCKHCPARRIGIEQPRLGYYDPDE
jgi:hypothetical protein